MTTGQSNVPAPTGPAPQPWALPDALRSRLAPAGLIVIVLVLWAILTPRPNPNEQLATRVTVAIINNDMRPVEREFNADALPQLENRARVGQLSQDLNELGKLKRIKEDTPKDARPHYHHFQAQFEKGTWEEDMSFDPDGKIAHFHAHAPGADSGR